MPPPKGRKKVKPNDPELPGPRGFLREPERYETTWRGIAIEIRYRPPFAHFYLKHPIAYLEVSSIEPKKAPLPISDTGYKSLVVEGVRVEAAGGPVRFVVAWLDREAKSSHWSDRQTPTD